MKNLFMSLMVLALALSVSFGVGYYNKSNDTEQAIRNSVGLMAPVVIVEPAGDKMMLNKLEINGSTYVIGKVVDNMRGGKVVVAADGKEVATVWASAR